VNMLNHIIIYTDGACSGNPGPGGWGAIVAHPEGHVYELGGGMRATTNNQMELTATIEALRSVEKNSGPIVLFTDSTYVIRGITQWIWGWKKNGWKTSEGKEVSNVEFWQELDRVVRARGASGKIDWKYSRGHIGTPGNERCDEIAVAFSKGYSVHLFDGNLLNYSVAIHDFPEETEVPEMKPRQEKSKVPGFYLSYVNGVLQKHMTWAECERVVKGRSGAKFKKCTSSEEEAQVLKSWGVS